MKSFWTVLIGVLLLRAINSQDVVFPTETSERIDQESFGECIAPNYEAGECIPLFDCKPLVDLLNTKIITHRIRDILKMSQCGYLRGKVLVCCSSGSQPRMDDSVDGANLLPSPGQCGTGSFDKIFGGTKAKIDDFPWMALLIYETKINEKSYDCGGVLINNRYILTAAHCVSRRVIPRWLRLSSVRLGEWDLNTNPDCDHGECSKPSIDVPIEEIIPHENFGLERKDLVHDIALLRLSNPVPYTEFIRPICLPSAQHLRVATFEGVSLDVAGWGMTENGSRSDVKRKATVKGVNLNDCQSIFQNYSIPLQGTQLCAGGEKDVDSCYGDSGGPLMGIDSTDPKRPYFFLAGIVSMGTSICGREGLPAVYTRVGSYIDWIQSKIRP